MSGGAYVDVALPLALDPLTYLVPDSLSARAVPGARVVVPVRGRRLVGIVTAVGRPAPAAAARPLLDAPDQAPVLDYTLLRLGRWIASHYAASLGIALRAMLPAPLFTLRGEAARGEPERLERVWRLAGRRLSLLEREERFRRAVRRREAYDFIERLGGQAGAPELKAAGVRPAALRALAGEGLIVSSTVRRERDPFAGLPASPPPGPPSEAQREALAALDSLGPGRAALLFGVTGSGKTLVYLEYLRRLIGAGGGAIVLVPEIGLTPQTVARFRGVFGELVAVLHSGLSDGERYDAWRALREGRKRVAVGARSAVFAPVPRLAAIVVDEEHDPSYKQGEAPRYHARDVALRRAALTGARVVLGSATPSLETWAAARPARGGDGAVGRGDPDRGGRGEDGPCAIRLVSLPERIGARPLPRVDVVDLRIRSPQARPTPVPWSEELDRAVEGALGRGEQVMLLLNRRGFSVFVQCPACGEVWECPNCSLTLTYHRVPAQLRCHHCDHRESPPAACRRCGEATQRLRGVGTQQVEEFVAQRFPSARLARMDLDTTAGKWAHHHILDEVARGRVDVLVGTQMIAKGLDFPNVTVVGVVDADVALNLPDFRSAERTFQLLTQVAGRAGRGPKGGRVVVQTRQRSHGAIECAARHDVARFVETELEERRRPAYPPHVQLANVVLSGASQRAVAAAAARVVDWLNALFRARPASRAEVVGPAPCPIERVRGRWRWHFLLRTRDGARLTRLVGYLAARAPVPGSVRLVVDRDPVALL